MFVHEVDKHSDLGWQMAGVGIERVIVALAQGAVGQYVHQLSAPQIVLHRRKRKGCNTDAGQGGSVGTGSRALKFGSSYLPYEVYSDAGLTTAFPVNAAALSVTLPGTGAAVALPIHGRINKTSINAMPAGNYVDVLQVTLT